jgi:hypothetical protein
MHNLTKAFSDFLLSREDRPDDGLLHVGSIANGCLRATWHEVKFGLKKSFDAVTQCKFRQGEQIEDLVRTGLAEHFKALGYVEDVYGQERVVTVLPGLVGHPDLVYRHPSLPTILGEVKSSLVFYDRVRKGVFMPSEDDLRRTSMQYIYQGTAYAASPEINAPEWFLFLIDRGTGQFESYWFTTIFEYEAFKARAKRFQAALESDLEPDVDLPGWTLKADGSSYLCKGCPVVSCERWSKANKAFVPPIPMAAR